MSGPGTLTAVQIGSQAVLTMSYIDIFRHAFTVERLFVNDDGSERWEPVPGCKYIKIGTAYDTNLPSGGTVTYRATAYDLLEEPNVLETDGTYTDPIRLDIAKWDATYY